MNTHISSVINQLESIKHISKKGGEYWTGRELMTVLGYTEWRNFSSAINRAIDACQNIGEDKNDHFVETNKVIETGKGAKLERTDYYLDRYACYLIAQNGDPSKPEIATAQTYFAIQTRLQEKTQANSQLALEQRLHLRNRVTQAVKSLNQTAKQAQVQNYAAFHDAGYKGLYNMGLADIKKRKNLLPKENLFDRAGRAELAANEFRLTQAELKIKKEDISNERSAVLIHERVGAEVRTTMRKIGGTMPEDLSLEPSLKQLLPKKSRTSKLLK